jgi:hypothetical protein
MPDTVVRDDAATYQRDAELYRVISQHPVRPIVFDVTPEEAAALVERFAEIFRGGPLDVLAERAAEIVRSAPFNVLDDTRDNARKQSDAALLSAIKQSR